MTSAEYVINQAKKYWSRDQQVPIDILMDLVAEGLDVEALENLYLNNGDSN